MKKSGFTLIEVLVVIALVAIVLAVVSILSGRLVAKQYLQASAKDFATVVKRAHVYSREAKDNLPWGVIADASTRQYTLVFGPVDSPTVSATYSLHWPAYFTAAPFSIWFGQGTGYLTEDTVVTIAVPAGDTSQISISQFGTVEGP